MTLKPFYSSKQICDTLRIIHQNTTQSNNNQSNQDLFYHVFKQIIKNIDKRHIFVADNGTRTRTNRAEVCYATPITSYPRISSKIFSAQKTRWVQYIVKKNLKSSNFLKKMVVLKNSFKAGFDKKTTKIKKNI